MGPSFLGSIQQLSIDLDAHAIPTIHAASFTDALRAQGYMHAQERFFEMDLLRRAPSGELAALFGERALSSDLAQKPFEFRTRARALLAELPAEHVEWLDAYTAGVNAGLADLRARPPEYWLFGAQPAAWQNEDSLLVVFAFYTMLSNNDSFERTQGLLHDVVPAAVYEFLTPSTSRFDRPVVRENDADLDRRLHAAVDSDERHDRSARQRRAGRKPRAARRSAALRPRVEPVGGRPIARRGRARVARERSAS